MRSWRRDAGHVTGGSASHDDRSGEAPIDHGGQGGSASRAGAARETRIDRVIAALASGQHGHVSREQLLALGLAKGAIDHRVAAGRLHIRHHGVYAVGHTALTPRAERFAAVLACGPGAVLSHDSAAVEWGILATAAVDAIHVTTPHRRTRPGIRTHQAALPVSDVTRRDGVPLTTPARTLLDLAATLDPRELARAVERARVARLVTDRDLQHLLQRARARRGARALRAILQDGPAFTRSDAERRLLALVARAQLPRPRTNVRVAGHEVDAVWPAQRLVVEVDGYRFHAGREAFERDRRRDADLLAAGLRVIRVTWRGLTVHPEAFVARLAATLARRPD